MPEARATAALNHPHIATLYDVGPDYLVMEFVEGETLRGPLPLARALLYAGQIPGRASRSFRMTSDSFLGRVARLSAPPDSAEL